MARFWPITGEGQQFPADDPQVMAALSGDGNTYRGPEEARTIIEDYLARRLTAIHDKYPGPFTLMLGGGIDSLLVADTCRALDIPATAITVAQPDSAEARTAQAIAERCGLDWKTVFPVNIHDSARKVVSLLETADVWEIGAGLIVREVFTHTLRGPVVSATGADVLFLGGRGEVPAESWRQEILESIGRHFTAERNIPDFYARLIGEENEYRVIKLWQTTAACAIGLACTKEIVRGPEGADKNIFRDIARSRGWKEEFWSAPKTPMQISSGIVDALIAGARTELALDPAHRMYTDPNDETLEFTVARLYLEGIKKWS